MSDFEEKYRPSKKAEKLEKFFQEKNIKNTCSVCGNEDWYVFDKGRTEGEPTLYFSNNFGMPVYTLTCINCGYIRQHLALIVDGDLAKAAESMDVE